MLTLIRDAEVLAPEPLGRLDVLVGGGSVLALGRDLAPGAGLVVRRVDANGALLVPGFVDSLVHLSGGGGEGGFETRTAALDPREALAAGVTTLIGALGTDDVTRSHADLLASARALSAHGLTAYALTGSYRVPVRTLTGSVRDDLVLLPDMIGVGEIAIADHRGSQPDVAELARIAADARVGGLLAKKAGTVLVHVGDGADGLALLHRVCDAHQVPVTQWHPTHVNRHAALLVQGRDWTRRGGSIDLTTSTTPALIAAGDIPADAALARLLTEGVPVERITLSSDGQASLPHFDPQGRLLDLQVARVGSLREAFAGAVREHRVPREAALTTITRTPARVWGLERKGRIAVGADADLVLLDPASLVPLATLAGGRSESLPARF